VSEDILLSGIRETTEGFLRVEHPSYSAGHDYSRDRIFKRTKT